MSDHCAIEKKYELPNMSGIYPIKEFGRFSEKAQALYENYASSMNNDGSADPSEIKILYSNTNYLMEVLKGERPGWINTDAASRFPYIAKKIEETGTNISVIEIDYIINDSITLTPINFANENKTEIVLISFNDYLRNGGFTQTKMGSFCSIVPNIFAGLKEFSNFFDNIGAISADLINRFNSIKNLGAKALIEQLKNLIIDTATSIFQDKLNKLDQFKIGDLGVDCVLNPSSVRILSRCDKVKNEIRSIFSGDNLKRINDKIEGLISYSIGVFERRDIEEIEFLVYRFCNLIQNLEQDSNNIMMRLKTFTDSYDYVMNTVNASSNANTARAIQAGAFRIIGSDLSAGVTENHRSYATQAEERDIQFVEPISGGEIDGVTSFNGGAGDSRIGFQGGWVSVLGQGAWDKTSPIAKVQMMRLQADFGRRLIVNSCYRSPAYNTRVGGAPNSNHMRGEALDMTWNGFRGASNSEKRDFIKLARKHGFNGFGGYSGFIHIDLGPPGRYWGIRY